MSDLRDRIAAEVLAECAVSSPAAYRVADAVIEALDSHGWLIDPESGKRTNKK